MKHISIKSEKDNIIMSKKFILLLGANQFQRERALIGAEKAFKGKVVTVSASAPYGTNKYPSITIKSNENNPEVLLRDVQKFCENYSMSPEAVIPLNDFVLNAGLSVAQHFNLPYNSAETINTCRTKDLMKTTLMAKNIPVVKSYRFSTLLEAEKIAEQIGYPLVVKPLNFGGSGGVYKVEDATKLADTILETQSHLNKYAAHYDSDPVNMLIEPYIDIKREVSVEIINTPSFRSVLGITDKFLSPEPHFSEIAHRIPSSFNQDTTQAKKITDIALSACEALDIKYGMTHVEMKVGSDGTIIVIEVGVRTAGDGIMDLYEKAMDGNMYELHCKSFLNTLMHNDVPTEFINSAAIGYLHPSTGTIEKINLDILNDEELKNIDLIAIRSQVGQEVLPAKDWSTRYGFIEYTLPPSLSADEFDVLKTTNSITQKIFSMSNQ